jgi:hypothetical protein
VPLPEAYRSLLRPSSPDEAKASINCCNWFMQTLTYSRRLSYPLTSKSTLNFQRTKSFVILFYHPPPASHPSICTACKMVGPDGLEPSTPRLSSACSNQLSYEPKLKNWRPDGAKLGGAGRVRTGDPLLAKQVLYQLSYGPILGYK